MQTKRAVVTVDRVPYASRSEDALLKRPLRPGSPPGRCFLPRRRTPKIFQNCFVSAGEICYNVYLLSNPTEKVRAILW